MRHSCGVPQIKLESIWEYVGQNTSPLCCQTFIYICFTQYSPLSYFCGMFINHCPFWISVTGCPQLRWTGVEDSLTSVFTLNCMKLTHKESWYDFISFWHVVLLKTVHHMDNDVYYYEWVWTNKAITLPEYIFPRLLDFSAGLFVSETQMVQTWKVHKPEHETQASRLKKPPKRRMTTARPLGLNT